MFLLDNVAFYLGPLPIYWYGIILGSGALVGLLLAIREGKRFGIPSDFFMDLLLIGVPSAIVGARLYYVIFTWDEYRDNWLSIFAIREGGIAIHGALIGAVLAAIWYTRRKGYNFWRIADICAPSLIAGQIIGRWGNFMNQEAHGGPVDPSFLRDTLHIPNFIVNHMNINGVTYHPTFLYESLWNIAGILLLFVLRRQRFMRAGELFMTYFVWYSIGRFFVEGLRTDSLAFNGPGWLEAMLNGMWAPMSWIFGEAGAIPGDANIRAAQLIGVLIILAAIVLVVTRRMLGLAHQRYVDPIQKEGYISS
ncbi:prolipoprotein diacylglyceryl transferase [Xylanibacillus composti]|uniref:Phosphatidylglycerol--prolipoprotein diacylglyceryl transferase n=1 Tax=Xylanibacillus composti TaxID=1572762 RepID=A0A8J4M506_9BACL|nr:prolipoprotein diacylglyceryl transferase [Xylanibacillus composti]MDT9725074.1 prolipoprotein diacylglyceryl transferase [Xylanibacillus composti]GIQ71526.1 prolipoprotein diacylglyceryl transferase [Xylanibacillus composti]